MPLSRKKYLISQSVLLISALITLFYPSSRIPLTTLIGILVGSVSNGFLTAFIFGTVGFAFGSNITLMALAFIGCMCWNYILYYRGVKTRKISHWVSWLTFICIILILGCMVLANNDFKISFNTFHSLMILMIWIMIITLCSSIFFLFKKEFTNAVFTFIIMLLAVYGTFSTFKITMQLRPNNTPLSSSSSMKTTDFNQNNFKLDDIQIKHAIVSHEIPANNIEVKIVKNDSGQQICKITIYVFEINNNGVAKEEADKVMVSAVKCFLSTDPYHFDALTVNIKGYKSNGKISPAASARFNKNRFSQLKSANVYDIEALSSNYVNNGG